MDRKWWCYYGTAAPARNGHVSVAGQPVRTWDADAVLVPREKIEALRKSVPSPRAYAPHCGSERCGCEMAGFLRLESVARDLLACAEPPKPKDEILEALRAAMTTTNTPSSISLLCLSAIRAREAELKARA